MVGDNLMKQSQLIFNIALILVPLSVAWSVVHFALATIDQSWWDIIPLIGMIIIAYGLVWFFRVVHKHRDVLPQIFNLFHNIATMLRFAEATGRVDFYERMTLPPDEFERQLRGQR